MLGSEPKRSEMAMNGPDQIGYDKHRRGGEMYIGILTESGKRVSDEDAFSCACERIERGTAEEKQMFLRLAKESETFEQFAGMLVEWWYSGNWIKKED